MAASEDSGPGETGWNSRRRRDTVGCGLEHQHSAVVPEFHMLGHMKLLDRRRKWIEVPKEKENGDYQELVISLGDFFQPFSSDRTG